MTSHKTSYNTASSVGEAIDFEASETSSNRVLVNKRPVPIAQCLVKSRPNTGWGVPVSVKNLNYKVTGASAAEAFKNVRDYLAKNGVFLDTLQIWFHLNRYWLPRVSATQRKVPVSALEALCVQSEASLIEREGYGPPLYGGLLWAVAGLYLAVSETEYDEEEMRTIYDPWNKLFLSKDSIGCEECSQHWSEAYAKADLSSRQLAREFFVSVQNEIRKRQERPPLTFSEQAQSHKWILLK